MSTEPRRAVSLLRKPSLVLAALMPLLAWAASPEPFTYIVRSGVATNATVTSEAKTVTGFEGELPVAVSGGANSQYKVGSGAWTSAAGSITAGQTLNVRHLSSSDADTETVTTVAVGDYQTTFRSITGAVDRTPAAFDFGTRLHTEPNSFVASEPQVLEGFNTGVAIQAGPNAQYRVDEGDWTNGAGTLQPGQALTTRHVSSSQYLAYTKTWLKVGGVTGYFTSRNHSGQDRDGDGVVDELDACPDEAGLPEHDGCAAPPPDADGDGVPDASDNCPDAANPGQEDLDGDGAGDACDAQDNRDTDGDGVENHADACPDEAGPASNAGCPLPPDSDGDGVADADDNCPGTPNPDQEDTDGDGIGDACDEPEATLEPDPVQSPTSALFPPSDQVDPASTGGRTYHIYLPSKQTGEIIAFSVFEPAVFVPARKHALVLQGHGFAMSRARYPEGYAPFTGGEGMNGGSLFGDMRAFVDAGFWVISIDQRGHGDSEGNVRLMDPDHEVQNVLQIVDWAESHLPHLLYRDGSGAVVARGDDGANLVLGATGGSYGGGYQLGVLGHDPQRRLDAIVPQITWHDLVSAIAPNDVSKSGWAVALIGAATASTRGRVDPFIYDEILRAAQDNRISPALRDALRYRSLKYFCDGVDLDGTTDEGLPFRPATPLPAVDALFFQGMTDAIFPLNQAQDSYECLKALGGDVRLYTYPFSHPSPSGIAGQGYPPFAAACSGFDCFALFQGYVQQFTGGGFGSADMTGCGNYDLPAMEVLWMRAKLHRDAAAIAALDDAPRYCLTLGVNRDAVTLDGVTPPPPVTAAIPPSELVINAAQPAPVTLPLRDITAPTVLAGIPKARITLEPGLPGPVVVDDDPIVFVGLARSRASYDGYCHQYADPWPFAPLVFCTPVETVEGASGTRAVTPSQLEVIDDQLIPIRGYGPHEFDLHGVAERLATHEQLHLVVFGWHYVYFASGSRRAGDLPLVLSGEIDLPLFGDLPRLQGELNVAPADDADGDGVANADDNCPGVANPDQADADGDGTGDACESGGGGEPAAYDVPFAPTPAADPFYAPAAGADSAAPGTVLRSRPIVVQPGGVALPNAAWQIQYATRDVEDRPITAVATVIKPLFTPPAGPVLVSHQFAYDSLGAQCTPSATLAGDPSNKNNMAETLVWLPGLMAQGWTVVIPDYEGPYHAYGAGKLSGQATLDGIRAALSFGPLGLNASTPVGMWGYSGGALATSWAATLQPGYAPELNIVGAYSGGTPADVFGVVRASENGPFFGLIFSAIVGTNRAYPELVPDEMLNDAGRAAFAAVKDACVGEGGPSGALADFTTVPDPYSSPGALAVRPKVSLPQPDRAPTMNMYLFHEILDELIPIGGTDALVDAWCEAGVPLAYFRSATGEHVGGAAAGAPSGYAYLASRFAGAPVVAVPPGARVCNQPAGATTSPVAAPPVTVPGYPPPPPGGGGGTPPGGGGGGGPLPDQCDPSGWAPEGARCLSDIPVLGPILFGG